MNNFLVQYILNIAWDILELQNYLLLIKHSNWMQFPTWWSADTAGCFGLLPGIISPFSYWCFLESALPPTNLRSASLEVELEMGILTQVIYWQNALRRNLRTHKESRTGQGKELSKDVTLWQSIASARFHRELWSVIDITGLSYLEFKGTELLPPPSPIFSLWQWPTQTSARPRDVGKIPMPSIPPKRLALTALFQGFTSVKSLMTPNSLRTRSYDSHEG